MHRNTFINSPEILNCHYQVKKHPKVFFAGQITGVEGYVESASSGMTAGINMAQFISEKKMTDFSSYTATGALSHYVSEGSVGNFQPMNVTFGIIEPLGQRVRKKKEKNELISQRALNKIEELKGEIL
jgi:methylenetetrahydrofolate--tRNA-(uracil-5-)-methyltransferase